MKPFNMVLILLLLLGSVSVQATSVLSLLPPSFRRVVMKNVTTDQSRIASGLRLGRTSLQKNSHRGGKAANGGMIFISLSLPDPLILQLCDGAARYHMPVIIRGLVDNNMPKTLKRLQWLAKSAKKKKMRFKGIAIDPVWFSAFHIDRVPAVLVTTRPANCIAQQQCPHQPFDVIYGTLSIQQALQALARDGQDAPSVAIKLLAGGHDA